MKKKYNLSYFVYRENFNKQKIESYNALNDGVVNEIVSKTKGISDKEAFAKEVQSVIRWYYWSRSEWEIILTDWPTTIRLNELTRLNITLDDYQKHYNRSPYHLTVNLAVDKKVDVYSQIMLNWPIFIDYLWNNLRGA